MTPIVIGFAGEIGSGKTTISLAISEARNLPRVSFGDFVRAEARRRGLDDSSRETLQQLGESLIADGWEPFCTKVLDQGAWQPGQSLVIDGIRHVDAARTLRGLVAPVPFTLVFLDAAKETRQARSEQQQARSEQQEVVDNKRREIETHSTEIEVATQLPSLADVVIQSNKPLHAVIADVLAWLDQSTDKGTTPVA